MHLLHVLLTFPVTPKLTPVTPNWINILSDLRKVFVPETETRADTFFPPYTGRFSNHVTNLQLSGHVIRLFCQYHPADEGGWMSTESSSVSTTL